MAKVHGKIPRKKHNVNEEEVEMKAPTHASAKLTISVKRRMGNGDEVFIAPGMELSCTPETLDEAKATVNDKVHAWLDELTEGFDSADVSEDDETETDDADDETDEDDADEEDEEGEITEAEIRKMKKAELIDFIEAEELDVDTDGLTLKQLRDALIDALADDDDDETDEDDADEDDDDDETDEDDADEDDADEAYTKAELQDFSLSELQAIADEWELKVRVKSGAKLGVKKATYTKAILKAQEEG